MVRSLAILSGYGALELKQAYRKNIAVGILAACLLHLIVIGVTIAVSGSKARAVNIVPIPVNPGEAVLKPPPTISQNKLIDKIKTLQRTELNVGVPVPVPDEEAPVEVEYATNREIEEFINSRPIEGFEEFGEGEIVIKKSGELLPEPGVFIAYEEYPEIIDYVHPEYPVMAQRAGITGTVWVDVLIDKNGKVRDVIIVKDSGANAGFEEAAVKAAYKTTWKPAISNSQPVAVWATYKIVFKFRQ